MSEHFFCTGCGRVSQAMGKRIDAIAKRHGASFTWTTLPGEGPRFWFACPSLGTPFDNATEVAVLADLIAAGLHDGTRLLVGGRR